MLGRRFWTCVEDGLIFADKKIYSNDSPRKEGLKAAVGAESGDFPVHQTKLN